MNGSRMTLGLCLLVLTTSGALADDADLATLDRVYRPEIQPLVKKFCHECHSGDRLEAEIDLSTFTTLAEVRKHPVVWQKVGEMLDSGQMPPKSAPQLSEAERTTLRKWVHAYLSQEAKATAGDPGRVVLRRLNNAEYTFTLRDLTGVDSLDPAREFPVDGAAGEGFTNTGNALVMSPALVTKYLDAAKEVASHAVLLPDGFRFSLSTTRRDWTNETLAAIRQTYERYATPGSEAASELRGSEFFGATVRGLNDGGVIPVERYLAALLAERAGQPVPAGLSQKYLQILKQILESSQPSPVLGSLREKWETAKPGDEVALAKEIGAWQRALWTFNPVGHIGKVRGPKQWMQSVSPLQAQADVRYKLPAAEGEIVLNLTATDAGDGADQDVVVWQQPRFVAPGRQEILLKDVRDLTAALNAIRAQVFSNTEKYLHAAAEIARTQTAEIDELAKRDGLDAEALRAWLDCLGISGNGPVKLEGHLPQKQKDGTYAFVTGWSEAGGLPTIVANSSGDHVRIPGNLKGHGVAVHPTPTLDVVVGWQSPIAGAVTVTPKVQHAHPECGNGVTWTLEHRRGSNRQRLASGIAHGGTPPKIDPIEKLEVQRGDVLALLIGPRDANHSCDLTAVDLTISPPEPGTTPWDLAADISPDIQAGNPHADRQGNANVWHFFTQPVSAGGDGFVIPKDSVLEKWRTAMTEEEQQTLAREVQQLLTSEPKKDTPDGVWVTRLSSFRGPILSRLFPKTLEPNTSPEAGKWGLDPALFGKHPQGGGAVEANSLCVKAPSVVEVRVPADLVAEAELVTAASIHADAQQEGCVQVQVLPEKPQLQPGLAFAANGTVLPLISADGSNARRRFEAALGEVRDAFPATLCYTKIVPVDEVVTLTLYYREDEHYSRLMLNDAEKADLDRLWSELHYISREAPELVAVLEQLIQYATQDSDPTQFEPLRGPYAKRAEDYAHWLVETEPVHLARLLQFADQAYRRRLTDAEAGELRSLYQNLRRQELSHEDSFRLTLARVLVAPAFLYRLEKPAVGKDQKPVTSDELANRLSYFLWSSAPDTELRAVAAQGGLQQPDVLMAQTRRMLQDAKTRRLATEFAAQWLHIHGFAQHDEKSERHFPTFAGLRSAMAEESTLFFTDLFQSNGSILEILDADHTFLNEDLAKHYGIPDVTGAEWRKVTGTKKHSRGGILTQATTLSTQAGASRTSPILRGNWLSEVVLGEKLPRPPKNVPQLPETAPEGLTERQLIEKHSTDEACAKCHARIDPPGFALEGFDAIGRLRDTDANGLKIDSNTQLQDGTKLEGLAGLQNWLLTARRDAFVRQFCKKLLGYALGRAVQLSDEPLLTEMQVELEAKGFKVQTALEKIVLSRQFREIRGREFVEAE